MSDEPDIACRQLKERMRTLQMATVGDKGEPHCGYTPFIADGSGFIVFVSQLSLHTRDMLTSGKVAVMLIDDEQNTNQLFARCRASYQCLAKVIDSQSDEYEGLLDQYQQRHGKMVSLLRQLPDFVLFRLTPVSGQFVMGFGKAYRLEGDGLDTFVHTKTA